MAAQILHLPVAPCHVPWRGNTSTTIFPSSRQQLWARNISAREIPKDLRSPTRSSVRATAPEKVNGDLAGGSAVAAGYETAEEIKRALYQAVEGINRGISGAPSWKKSEIEGFVKLLESRNPTPYPTDNLAKVDGCWKLVYSTVSILGSKRTKLGLRDFITLGDFLQKIDTSQGKAINEIKFNARGFKMLTGQLSIVASFAIASKTRVDIKFENSEISPDQLMDLFQKNYDILLAVFNPDGWLEITYVDESLRIGRDDKGNIFVLERFVQEEE